MNSRKAFGTQPGQRLLKLRRVLPYRGFRNAPVHARGSAPYQYFLVDVKGKYNRGKVRPAR